ncbi:MAG: hypothetical protein KatS3mg110_2232 [Pirellulaceae bacterium]|nr:MAG: hypothetical protein KatS3mg110_2232 [Pirellulaceae bacterium]
MEPNSAGRFTADEHRAAVVRSRAERDETLAAIHQLESALAAPAPGRESAWGQAVLEGLKRLEKALLRLQTQAAERNHLWSDIQQISPRLQRRINRLRWQLDDLCRQAGSLRAQLEHALEETPDYADFRRRVALLIAGIRHFRDQEADLIYEAYQVDIGTPD